MNCTVIQYIEWLYWNNPLLNDRSACNSIFFFIVCCKLKILEIWHTHNVFTLDAFRWNKKKIFYANVEIHAFIPISIVHRSAQNRDLLKCLLLCHLIKTCLFKAFSLEFFFLSWSDSYLLMLNASFSACAHPITYTSVRNIGCE